MKTPTLALNADGTLESSADNSVYRRALTRVQQDFARTTDALIQAIFQNSRQPSEVLAGRIQFLETKRDELHARLEELEMRAASERRLSAVETSKKG